VCYFVYWLAEQQTVVSEDWRRWVQAVQLPLDVRSIAARQCAKQALIIFESGDNFDYRTPGVDKKNRRETNAASSNFF